MTGKHALVSQLTLPYSPSTGRFLTKPAPSIEGA